MNNNSHYYGVPRGGVVVHRFECACDFAVFVIKIGSITFTFFVKESREGIMVRNNPMKNI